MHYIFCVCHVSKKSTNRDCSFIISHQLNLAFLPYYVNTIMHFAIKNKHLSFPRAFFKCRWTPQSSTVWTLNNLINNKGPFNLCETSSQNQILLAFPFWLINFLQGYVDSEYIWLNRDLQTIRFYAHLYLLPTIVQKQTSTLISRLHIKNEASQAASCIATTFMCSENVFVQLIKFVINAWQQLINDF